ncbi:MAG: endo alpha-1,4 polygalactosaminidase [Trueperaceae bacterium]|nr:endo alpha-1,4 polygalactosaminidase [Trueperaceae bacterium]
MLIGLLLAGFIARAQTPSAHFQDIKNYMIFYGQGQLDQLVKYDLVIIQPDSLSQPELHRLKAEGTLIVAYLSLGEVEPQRPWYGDGRFNSAWSLGRNPLWGSYWVDASQVGWQELMLSLASEYIAMGFDGLFLDTIDTVNIFPQTKAGMIHLIERLDAHYPNSLLIQNRGLALLDDVLPYIDALMVESLSSTYDFVQKDYVYVDNAGLALELSQFSKKTGLPVLSLDYANSALMAESSRQLALSYGFLPAVSEIWLDSIPNFGLE